MAGAKVVAGRRHQSSPPPPLQAGWQTSLRALPPPPPPLRPRKPVEEHHYSLTTTITNSVGITTRTTSGTMIPKPKSGLDEKGYKPEAPLFLNPSQAGERVWLGLSVSSKHEHF